MMNKKRVALFIAVLPFSLFAWTDVAAKGKKKAETNESASETDANAPTAEKTAPVQKDPKGGGFGFGAVLGHLASSSSKEGEFDAGPNASAEARYFLTGFPHHSVRSFSFRYLPQFATGTFKDQPQKVMIESYLVGFRYSYRISSSYYVGFSLETGASNVHNLRQGSGSGEYELTPWQVAYGISVDQDYWFNENIALGLRLGYEGHLLSGMASQFLLSAKI